MSDIVSVSDLEPLQMDGLFSMLGGELLGEGLGIGGEDSEEKARFGREWFEGRFESFRQQICSSGVARHLSGDFPDDVAAVLGALGAFAAEEKALALIVAAIAVRRGVSAMCD